MDLINDSIPKLLLKIATPASIGFFFNTMYNVVDTYWGGRLSTETLAALSLSFAVFFIIIGFSAGLSSGTTALIANLLGGGDEKNAIKIHAQAITLGCIVMVVMGVVLFLTLKPILSVFNPTPALEAITVNYLRIVIAGGVFFALNNIYNAALSARGDTKTYRNFLIAGFILNIVLDPLFMFGLTVGEVTILPEMRERGIALATVLIQIVGSVYMAWRVSRIGALPKTAAFYRPEKAAMIEIVTQSVPATLNTLTTALGTFLINFFIARSGTEAVAAYGAGIRIEQIALVPTFGLTTALTTIAGQNNGAGKRDRVIQTYKTALRFGLIIMLVVYTPIFIFGRNLLKIFTNDPEVTQIGLTYLRIQALTFYSYILLFQSNSLLQAIKRPGMIFYVGLYRQFIAPVVIFALFSFWWGVSGVWWGLVIVNWSAALFMAWHVGRVTRSTTGS